MEAEVDICGQELLVEYEFKITSRGHPGTRPSLDHPGDPPEGCEFEIEVLGARFPEQDADVPNPVLPEWLVDVITTHLMDRDDIYAVVREADSDPDYGRDPDDERDKMIEDREARAHDYNEDD